MNANTRIYFVGVAWPSSRGLRTTILNIHAIGNDVLYIYSMLGYLKFNYGVPAGRRGVGGGGSLEPPSLYCGLSK